jgi:PEP-CTERM motif
VFSSPTAAASLAVLALSVLPSPVRAEACTSYLSLFTGPACHGTGVNTSVSFKAYSDENPVFGSTIDLQGGGASETTSAYFPDTLSPNRSVVGYGGLAASTGTVGSFRGESADAFAAASLGTGGLKVAVGSTALPADPQSSVLNAQQSNAWLRDQISVIFPKVSDTIEITLTMAVTGTVTPSPLFGSPGAQAQFVALDSGGQALGSAGRLWSSPGAVSDTLSDTFMLLGQVDLGDRWLATFDLQAGLFTNNAIPGSRIDFGNSAYLDIRLPQAATFTSASGAFLATPVPEPSTWVLMAGGLAAVLWPAASRRRRQQAAPGPTGA